MAQYSFPILENDELLPCMEEMEIPLTAAQLAKPTYEVVGPLFESVLISLTGITRCGGCCPRSCSPAHAVEPPAAHNSHPPCTPDCLCAGRSSTSRCLQRSTRLSTQSCTTSPSQRATSTGTSQS